jgi:hypothetical protein
MPPFFGPAAIARSSRSRCAVWSLRITAKPSMARRMLGVTLYQSLMPSDTSRTLTASSTVRGVISPFKLFCNNRCARQFNFRSCLVFWLVLLRGGLCLGTPGGATQWLWRRARTRVNPRNSLRTRACVVLGWLLHKESMLGRILTSELFFGHTVIWLALFFWGEAHFHSTINSPPLLPARWLPV